MKRILSKLLALLVACALGAGSARADAPAETATAKPNFLFAIADDWSWPHAGAYGDPVVKTPTFDRLAREGALFHNAHVSSPSCTPSRGAILTGQWHWRLEGAANLWSVFPDKFTTYPELLEKAGYSTGSTGKAWGPGRTQTRGRQLAGARYQSFQQFLQRRPAGRPFCFWLGSSDPHRPYKKGSGAASGMDLGKIRLPACFPDAPEVRGDVADYYVEVQRFDGLVGAAVAALERAGELDRTVVVVTSDNGMPFPRSKSNLYDMGTRMPLVVRWGGQGKPGREVEDFVSLTDFGPTFLELAGLEVPDAMTGRSLVPVLRSTASGRVDARRTFVLTGKERHCPTQEGSDPGGYPCRAIRTHEFLYVRNFTPERWPAGTPNYEKAHRPGSWYGDCDNGPTKTYMVESQDRDAAHRKLFDLAFAKRPGEELYDLREDPDQLRNVAGLAEYAEAKKRLAAKLQEQLEATRDPRVVGGAEAIEMEPYLGGAPSHPDWKPPKK